MNKNPMDLIFLVTFSLSSVLVYADSFTSKLARHVGLKYDSHKTSSTQLCSDEEIKDQKGNITSPGYPIGYPSHISCSWRISANVGEVITIVFHDLDIEESGVCEESPCCTFNWIKIGPTPNGTERQYCGQDNTYLRAFVSTTNKVKIKFHISYALNGGRGFQLFFSVGSKRNTSCENGEFHCGNGICLSQNVRCNGYNDCNDGSDEEFCSEYCPTGRSCRSSLYCYDEKKRCDGIFDCRDLSDELGCSPCSTNETLCGGDSNQCYNPLVDRCNRIMDCANGIDEKDCERGCPGKIRCSSGIECYLPEEHCNGIAQCSDSSDEKNCGPDLCNYERGGFLCGNGHCIREMWKCDRTNDCGDGTDEYNCLRNSVLTAAIMGSLICALLLVIAISCTCRLYALRALENHMSNRESIMSRVNPEFLFREPPPSYAVAVGEHQRNLYVENVHYNPCPRRGRRRIRRARRHPEARRSSVSLLDNLVHLNRTVPGGPPLNFPFPCLPTGAMATDRSPSPEMPQTSCSDSTTCVSVTSSSEAECWDTGQNIRDSVDVEALSGNCSELDKDKHSGESLSINAESSFSELPMVHKKQKGRNDDETHQGLSSADNQSVDNSFPVHASFHTGSSILPVESVPLETTVDRSQESLNITGSYCDNNDMQPLIT